MSPRVLPFGTKPPPKKPTLKVVPGPGVTITIVKD